MRNHSGLISSIKHPAVVEARRRIGQIGAGPPTAFVVDGLRLVSQALRSNAPLERVFFLAGESSPEEEVLRSTASEAGAPCHDVNRGVFFRILGLGYETSVTVLGIARAEPIPPGQVLKGLDSKSLIVLGEDIQDPRNVGVMIRNADATGVSSAVFTSGSANPYSRQTLRSSTGSLFRVPLSIVPSAPVFLEELRARNVKAIGTSAHAEKPYWEASYTQACAVLFGNEGAGLSKTLRSLCDEWVRIPIQGGASSLNVTVAHGVILCEAARQRGLEGY